MGGEGGDLGGSLGSPSSVAGTVGEVVTSLSEVDSDSDHGDLIEVHDQEEEEMSLGADSNALKRTREDGSEDVSSEEKPRASKAKPTLAPGAYVGHAKAMARLRGPLFEDWEDSEEETSYLRKSSTQPALSRAAKGKGPAAKDNGPTGASREELLEAARNSASLIIEEAKKCGNLNGSVWGRMNVACRTIISATEDLLSRSESEEVRRIKADNKRMKEQLAHLEAETRALRAAFAERSAKEPGRTSVPPKSNEVILQELLDLPQLLKDMKRELFTSIGEMVNVRLGELEKRLPAEPRLRPPLEADRRNAARENGGQAARPPLTQPLVPPAPAAVTPAPAKTAKAKAQKPAEPKAGPSGLTRPAPVETRPLPVAPSEGTWTEVVKKGKSKKTSPTKPPVAEAGRRATASKTAPQPKRLEVPSSAAVVVALKPEANSSYLDVMGKATSLNLEEVGLTHVKVRRTMTGARIIEIPGKTSGAAADRLAEKLRGLVGDVADISRPTKMAEVKVSGLDESASPEAVKAIIVEKGGCSAEQVKPGTIRFSNSGSGAIIVRCPVTAARAIVAAGRIQVGWSLATVEALEALPLRCFKCMAIGHTRALCPSPVDRSNLCYRCGKEGHISRECAAEPWCSVCSSARRPEGHIMGGPACNPPSARGRQAPAGSPVPQRRDNSGEGNVMDL